MARLGKNRRKPWEAFNLQGETPQQAKAKAAQPQVDDQPAALPATATYRYLWSGNSFRSSWSIVPAEPPKPLEKHLVAGPTMGYRLWPVYANQSGDLWLGSMGVQAEPWMMGTPTKARCVGGNRFVSWPPRDHASAPEEHCDCGLYAVNDLRHLDLYRDPVARNDGTCIAIAAGRVSLWGRVYEHEKGYRAQYAYPAALWPYQTAPMPHGFPQPRRWLETFLRLGETYGVPIFPEAP